MFNAHVMRMYMMGMCGGACTRPNVLRTRCAHARSEAMSAQKERWQRWCTVCDGAKRCALHGVLQRPSIFRRRGTSMATASQPCVCVRGVAAASQPCVCVRGVAAGSQPCVCARGVAAGSHLEARGEAELQRLDVEPLLIGIGLRLVGDERESGGRGEREDEAPHRWLLQQRVQLRRARAQRRWRGGCPRLVVEGQGETHEDGDAHDDDPHELLGGEAEGEAAARRWAIVQEGCHGGAERGRDSCQVGREGG